MINFCSGNTGIVKNFIQNFINLLDTIKIDNLKKKNRDHKKVPKPGEDTGNL